MNARFLSYNVNGIPLNERDTIHLFVITLNVVKAIHLTVNLLVIMSSCLAFFLEEPPLPRASFARAFVSAPRLQRSVDQAHLSHTTTKVFETS
jgi:hypothetical protein